MALGVFFSLIVGLSFLIGIFINHSNERLNNFSYALAFIIMIGLILFDLLPEINFSENLLLILPAFLGFIILIILDKFIPDHHHDHKNKDDDIIEHNNHLNHIGKITIIALTIHNMIEGLALYNLTTTSIKGGLLMMISVSLHNIPLSFQIGNSIKKEKNKLLITLLVLSSLIGALIIIIFGNLNENIISILTSLTLGMILYILIFEIFHEYKNSFNKTESIYGIIIGIVVVIITILL